MKKYFYNEGDEHFGPFSVEELKSHRIDRSTLVWAEGWTDWKEAREEVELKPLFLIPPPVRKKEIPPTVKHEEVEKTYYTNEQGIRITSTRLIVGGSTYPINGVTAVHINKDFSRNWSWLAISALGFLLMVSGENDSPKVFGAFIVTCGVTLFLMFGKKYNYSLQIQTLAGSIDILHSKNKKLIQEMSAAINNAIIQRG